MVLANRQVDGLKSKGVVMLIKINNSWIKFKVLWTSLTEEERVYLAKETFLYVIYRYNAFFHQKEKMLDEVAKAYPDIDDAVSDGKILLEFQYFCQEAGRRNEIVSPAELKWVKKYVRYYEVQLEIEELIYCILLRASSHWDKMRQDFGWTISAPRKLEFVREILRDKKVGSKRKLELAEEFGESKDDFARSYYKKLLYDRHYDKAKELSVENSDVVVDVVVANINNGYPGDALDIVERFLPYRKDLVEEIQQIIAALNG